MTLEPINLTVAIDEPFETTAVGLVVHGSPSYEIWEAYTVSFQRMGAAMPFLIGDLLVWGEDKFGEKYSQAITDTGLGKQTLANYASICRRIPMEVRREDVSFSHHGEVAALPIPEQKRLLEEVANQGWTVPELREAIREKAGLPAKSPFVFEAVWMWNGEYIQLSPDPNTMNGTPPAGRVRVTMKSI
jgi:hypothetical protein